MDNLISRQAAIDALEKLSANYTGVGKREWRPHVRECQYEIQHMPSAQPEIIRCKECKHSEHWYRDRRRCFLWAKEGISVFNDGFCNYADRGEQDDVSR